MTTITRPGTQTMSAEQAQMFERFSAANSSIVLSSLSCECSPYDDVFTFNRWKAQGMIVKRGEHGIKLPLIRRIQTEDEAGTVVSERKILGRSTVFCRCQVQGIGTESMPAPPPTPEPEQALQPELTPQPAPAPEPETRGPGMQQPESKVDKMMKGWNVV